MKHIIIITLIVLLASCSSKNEKTMNSKTIMEVTIFNIIDTVSPTDFKNRDLQVENDFTNKQAGFINRQSGINEKGEYVVVVFWETLADADASMAKFMKDASVADYAQMINGASMKMARYNMDKAFDAKQSKFIEIMTFDLAEGVKEEKFNKINQKVETEVTSKRAGFIQRLTGVNEKGKQVVAIYWENKENSDAALEPFMANDLAKKFMSQMTQSSVWMGRYNTL